MTNNLNLAISNISWKPTDDEKLIFDQLHQMSVTGIEIAPTKIWSNINEISDFDVISYRKTLNNNGFAVPAIQSILFGHPEFQIFDSTSHIALFEHLKKMFDICNLLGGSVAVFGCPKNRCYNSLMMPKDDAYSYAYEIFSKIGDIAKSFDCIVGLEANPAAYKCNFLNTIDEVDFFVKKVCSNNVKTHFDVGACIMNDENVCDKILKIRNFCHFHISTSYLENIADSVVDYNDMFKSLNDIDYKKWVSIEMKQIDPSLYNIKRALKSLV